MGTPFSDVYNSFLAKITDDMYMEVNQCYTESIMQDMLEIAISKFEFPRVDLFSFGENEDGEMVFNATLSKEEINIISTYMIVEWIGVQLASVENTRMKYSGSDFKFTSQANHMHKLLTIKKDYEREGFHLQRLYSRRQADDDGVMKSTFGKLREVE